MSWTFRERAKSWVFNPLIEYHIVFAILLYKRFNIQLAFSKTLHWKIENGEHGAGNLKSFKERYRKPFKQRMSLKSASKIEENFESGNLI